MATPSFEGVPELRMLRTLTRAVSPLRGRERLLLVVGIALLTVIVLLAALAPLIARSPWEPPRLFW